MEKALLLLMINHITSCLGAGPAPPELLKSTEYGARGSVAGCSYTPEGFQRFTFRALTFSFLILHSRRGLEFLKLQMAAVYTAAAVHTAAAVQTAAAVHMAPSISWLAVSRVSNFLRNFLIFFEVEGLNFLKRNF